MLSIDSDLFYKKFPAFQFITEVNELLNPFFKTTKANYFDYCRFYEDNSFFTLTTDPFWLEHFFKTKHLLAPAFEDSGKHLWNSTYYSTLIHDARILFNHDHGISIFFKRDGYLEYIDIAAPRDQRGITSIYLNQFDLIENFINDFVEKADQLIMAAESQTILIPGEMLDAKPAPKVVDAFTLTEREKVCLEYLVKGYTAKETAMAINISGRTVEHHLNNIKVKLKCDTNRDLVKLFYNVQI